MPEGHRSSFLKPEEVGSSSGASPVYDVIIVGGGTSGLALASRLSEAAELSVLVLEAGGSAAALEDATVPSGWKKLLFTEHDWKYFTAPQTSANGHPHYIPRGKFLGGCSSMNGMMFHHCAPEDYDQWARLGGPGAETWAYEHFKDYLRKLERRESKEALGKDGPFQAGHHNFVSELGTEFVESCNAVGISKCDDINTSKSAIGSSLTTTAISDKGVRVSTETAYLTPDVLARPNLKVALGCHTRRIVIEDKGGIKTAVGVEYSASGSPSTVYRANASKEVILSAGGIESPHLLLLSGVGPARDLEAHGIPVIHDLAGVGAQLVDHPTVILRFKCKPGSSKSLQYLSEGEGNSKVQEAIEQFKSSGKGPLSSGGTDAAAFFKSTDENLYPPSEYPENVNDRSSGPNAPDLELMLIPYAPPLTPGEVLPEGDYISVAATLLRPASSGSITLKSSDPFDPPIIDPNFFAIQNDVDVLARGLRMAMRIIKTDPLASSLDWDDTNPALDFGVASKTDAELKEIVKMRGSSTFHPGVSAKMGPLKVGGVVDARLKVHGVHGLRVVDTSIFPCLPSGHTMVPAIAVGEKAADLIKEDHKLAKKTDRTIQRFFRHIRTLSKTN